MGHGHLDCNFYLSSCRESQDHHLRIRDYDTKARRVSRVWDNNLDSGASIGAQTPDSKFCALSLDTSLFAPIAQMGPPRLQDQTYVKWLVWDINPRFTSSGPRARSPTMSSSAFTYGRLPGGRKF